MKKLFYLNLPIVVLIMVIFSCSDKVVQEPTYNPPPSPPPVNPTITPTSTEGKLRITAGIDQLIFLPITETRFSALAFDVFKYKTDLKYEWKKIKGPDNYTMDDSTLFNPMLSKLETGLYEFAFTATTPDGRFETDTVNIQVVQPIGEFTIPKLSWSCPFGCLMQLDVRIPKDKSVRIYIKPVTSVSSWVELTNIYPTTPPFPTTFYTVDKESLSIYSDDDKFGIWDLKIVFQ